MNPTQLHIPAAAGFAHLQHSPLLLLLDKGLGG
jgi:hypothetical protein